MWHGIGDDDADDSCGSDNDDSNDGNFSSEDILPFLEAIMIFVIRVLMIQLTGIILMMRLGYVSYSRVQVMDQAAAMHHGQKHCQLKKLGPISLAF